MTSPIIGFCIWKTYKCVLIVQVSNLKYWELSWILPALLLQQGKQWLGGRGKWGGGSGGSFFICLAHFPLQPSCHLHPSPPAPPPQSLLLPLPPNSPQFLPLLLFLPLTVWCCSEMLLGLLHPGAQPIEALAWPCSSASAADWLGKGKSFCVLHAPERLQPQSWSWVVLDSKVGGREWAGGWGQKLQKRSGWGGAESCCGSDSGPNLGSGPVGAGAATHSPLRMVSKCKTWGFPALPLHADSEDKNSFYIWVNVVHGLSKTFIPIRTIPPLLALENKRMTPQESFQVFLPSS